MANSTSNNLCSYRFWLLDSNGKEHTPSVNAVNCYRALVAAVDAVLAEADDEALMLSVLGHQAGPYDARLADATLH